MADASPNLQPVTISLSGESVLAGDHRLTAYKDEIAAETGRFFAWLLAAGATPPQPLP